MSWKTFATAGLAVLLLSGGAWAQNQQPKEDPANVHKSDTYKYSIQFPEGDLWEWGQAQQGQDCLIQKKKPEGDNTFLVLGVQVIPPEGANGKSAKEFAQDAQKQVRDIMKEIRKDKIVDTKFAGCSAIQVSIQGREKQSSTSLVYEVFVFRAGNQNTYIVFIQALEGQEEEHAKDLKKILTSFRWWK